jgi:hypothetical protein
MTDADPYCTADAHGVIACPHCGAAAVAEHADRIERMLLRACEAADVPYYLLSYVAEAGRPIRFTVRGTLSTAQFHALRDAIAAAIPIDPLYGVTRFEIEAGGV